MTTIPIPQFKKSFDVVVIGGGISASLSFALLARKYPSIALICPEGDYGGDHKVLTPATVPLKVVPALNFLPDTAESEMVIERLQQSFPEFQVQKKDLSPLTYENAQFREFAGFGNEPPLALDAVSSFVQTPSFYKVKGGLAPFIQTLQSTLSEDQRLLEHVTSITPFSGNGIGIELNGTYWVKAQQVIFCDHPLKLLKWMHADHISGKLAQKLSKKRYWTSLKLSLIHSDYIGTAENLHLLMGSKREPVLGLFENLPSLDPMAEDTIPTSVWTSFLPHEGFEDNEMATHILKEMKRQILRAYSGGLNNLRFERLSLVPGAYGTVGDLLDGATHLRNLPELHLAGGLFSPHESLLGELYQPLKVFQNAFPDLLQTEANNEFTPQSDLPSSTEPPELTV